MPISEIVSRLDDRFGLLVGGSRVALTRQQTLRATVDWSYELLTQPERILLRRLAVFAGGFSMDAAEAVCADELLDADGIADLLAPWSSDRWSFPTTARVPRGIACSRRFASTPLNGWPLSLRRRSCAADTPPGCCPGGAMPSPNCPHRASRVAPAAGHRSRQPARRVRLADGRRPAERAATRRAAVAVLVPLGPSRRGHPVVAGRARRRPGPDRGARYRSARRLRAEQPGRANQRVGRAGRRARSHLRPNSATRAASATPSTTWACRHG